jgi:DNA-binding SARP family transcriptional activator
VRGPLISSLSEDVVTIPPRTPLDSVARARPLDACAPQLFLLDGFTLCARDEVVSLPLVAQRLVAFVALADHPVPRIRASGALWPMTTDEHAFASLRSTLWRLNARCEGVIEAGAADLRLGVGVSVDVSNLITRMRTLLDPLQDSDQRDLHLLFARELLPGWYDDWVLIERKRLSELRLQALESLGTRRSATGRYNESEAAFRAAIALEPLRESPYRGLMCVLAAQGNQGQAISTYRCYAALLEEELDTSPSEQMRGLAETMLRRW